MKTKKSLMLLLPFIMATISCEQENLIIVDNETEKTNLVSLEDARMELEQLLSDLQNQSTRSSDHPRKVISEAFSINDFGYQTKTGDASPVTIHIFNFENGAGYAIMAGNSEVPSLLALTDAGQITETQAVDNPGFAVFAANMEQTYMLEIEEGDPGDSLSYRVYGAWENIVYKENGYCDVTWNQGNPYNALCPVKDGENTLTGCVATAVAQLMSIYKYPTSYGDYSFDWEEMTEYPRLSSCSAEGKNQVARLMVELGSSSNLDVDYDLSSNGGSGADPANIPRTLVNFGYSDGGSLNDYSTSTVVSELKQGYSVLVGGKSHKTVTKVLGIKISTTYSGGHRWLCHGLLERRRTVSTYNSSTGALINSFVESIWYPLCNWGWGGTDDGYYLSNAFDASSGPVYETTTKSDTSDESDKNYQYKVTAVTGIRK